MHILTVTINEDFRCLKKDSKIELKPLTLLVGEQGCGKSSLLELLQKNDVTATVADSVSAGGGVNTFYFDIEKMNPRVVDPQLYTNPDGTNKGIGLGSALSSRYQSHGEILREFTVNKIKSAKDCVLFLDEPESALSPKNQFKLSKEIKNAHKKNVQIIASTHCIPLIESVDEVFSMETLTWISSKEYIEQSKNINE
jgi:predicted ATPase